MDQTKELQKKIDASNQIVFKKGEYFCGPLFFHSDMEVVFEEGSIFHLSDEETDFMKIPTRIAGIEMDGYPALLNFISCRNVQIHGKGVLLGNGKRWYEKYWGIDKKGGMRKEYDANGLRWACDYDCFRPKMILFQNCSDMDISDLTLKDSPFWNFHILYSSDICARNLTILSEDENSPSTDGIDIDSSHDISIRDCMISTNDDAISIKSGRDMDGLRVHQSSHHIKIEDCIFRYGYGVSIGSELSGGIENITCRNLIFKESSCGFRIKSSNSRKGYVKNVVLDGLDMLNVKYPIYCYLDWNRQYNENKLPLDYKGEVPSYWKTLLQLPPSEMKNTEVENLEIQNLYVSQNRDIGSCLFTFKGFEDSPISCISIIGVQGVVDEFGTFENCSLPRMENMNVLVTGLVKTTPGEFDNR
jgi:polygalacturonase